MNKNLSPKDLERLDLLEKDLHESSSHLLGYPCTIDFDYSLLSKFLKYPVNNVGDAYYSGGTYQINTHTFEREVNDFFAQMFNAPSEDYWGYITNGSTEGNLYGLYLARQLYPLGIVNFSEDSHYSIQKI
ncbi:PLP-dependent aminotransferase family protein [Chryseobacterium polytrichastri]|uniref:Histidine decarboxylase n=1 Tax=Chryseobacterium polytrichastri TaxID=1302687 RepID=A0A1M7L2H9_9FLAO|nr:hypothetical protein [Chryseobacterium polytrichastri]SHM72078.1 hypothetical protein SAMN05444267_10811 [Chryseobacterium polytrichastri]